MRRSDEPRGDVEDRSYGFPVGLWRALKRNPPRAWVGAGPGTARCADRG